MLIAGVFSESSLTLLLCSHATVASLLSAEKDVALLTSTTIISYLFSLNGSYSCLHILKKNNNKDLKEQWGLHSAFVVEYGDVKLLPPTIQTLPVYRGQQEGVLPWDCFFLLRVLLFVTRFLKGLVAAVSNSCLISSFYFRCQSVLPITFHFHKYLSAKW